MSFDITELIRFNPTRELKKRTLAPFVSMAALQENHKFIKEVELREFTGGAKFKNGDTLFARITPCLENGKTAMVTTLDGAQVGHGSTEFIVMSPINESDSQYVYYLSRLPEFRQYAKSRMEGTSGRQRVSWQALSEFSYPFPSQGSRERIGLFLSLFDKKIELNSQINDTLEAMAEAIFKSWFVDFDPVHAKIKAKAEGLDAEGINHAAMAVIASKSDEEIAKIKTESTEKYERLKSLASLFPDQLVESELGLIPEGWEVLSFSEWIQVTKGKSITKAKVNPGNVPVVAGGLEPAYYHNESNVKGPAITISASGANAGYVNLYYQDIWSSDSSYIAHNETKAFYVAYVCLKYRQKEIFSMQTGAAQPHIYPKDFERLMIVKPSEALLDSLEAIYQGFFNLISDNKKESITLAEIRDTLLPKLLSGEIEVA